MKKVPLINQALDRQKVEVFVVVYKIRFFDYEGMVGGRGPYRAVVSFLLI